MRLVVPKTMLNMSAESVIMRAGYAKFVDPNTRQTSFVRRLGAFFYPRFHAYIKDEGEKAVFDLHVDQKKASYEGVTKHSGEYTGEKVATELHRIRTFI